MTVTRKGRVVSFGRGPLWQALVPYLATRLPLVLVGTLSVALLPLSRYVPAYWIIPGLDRVFDAFSRWDAWHYTRIAEYGYIPSDPSRTAFFPLFPALTRIVAELQGRTDRPGEFLQRSSSPTSASSSPRCSWPPWSGSICRARMRVGASGTCSRSPRASS